MGMLGEFSYDFAAETDDEQKVKGR